MDNQIDHIPKQALPQIIRKTPTKIRYLMLALVLAATIINYIDRVNMSIATPFLTKEFGVSKVDLGFMLSAFSWTYTVAIIPGGYIADRFGSRIGYALSLATWSLATIFQGLAANFAMLFGARLAVGAFEAPAFPSNARAVSMWFPASERGLATAIYVMGQYIGTALFSGVLLWMTAALGWRSMFAATGLVGLVFGCIWYLCYRDPGKSKLANQAELDYIRSGGGVSPAKKKQEANFGAILTLLKYRQIWAICIGKFCSFSALTFFLTWFPTYLIEQRHMHMLKAGFFLMLPYIGASVGVLLAGGVADMMIRRGFSISFARKTPLVTGALLGITIMFADQVPSDAMCIAILTLAFFAQGLSSTSWAAVSECAPEQYVGLTSGITSMSANIAGVVVPIVIGFVVHATGSFDWALRFVGGLSVIGALSYSLLLGRLHRIVID